MKKFRLKIFILICTCLSTLMLYNFKSLIFARETKIDFLRYSIDFPGNNWEIDVRDEDNQIVRFKKIETKRENSLITISYVPVLDPDLWKLNEEELAKNFIANEKLTMVLLGEKKGLYKLTNVVEGIDTVNGKKFYTMSYRNIMRGYIVDGLLYVYIPPAEEHKELFSIIFTNGHRKDKPVASSFEEFIEILRGLDIKK